MLDVFSRLVGVPARSFSWIVPAKTAYIYDFIRLWYSYELVRRGASRFMCRGRGLFRNKYDCPRRLSDEPVASLFRCNLIVRFLVSILNINNVMSRSQFRFVG
jgi:hypothetical protein